MVIFIFRLNAEHIFPSRMMNFQNSTKFQEMTKVKNVFYCQLSKKQHSSIQDGVHLQISQVLPLTIYLVWGAFVNTVYEEFLKDTKTIKEEVENLTFMEKKCWKIEKIERSSNSINPVVVDLECPSVLHTNNYGEPSRQYYPLVVIMVQTENNLTSFQHEYNVNAMMTIIHLQDSQTALQSYIIGQYVKLDGRQVFSLQPIFVTSSDEVGELGTENNLPKTDSSNNCQDTDICVVCQNLPVSHVVLPCRHACVCSNCFQRIEKCPMCRGYLDSYFTLHETNIEAETADNSTDSLSNNFQTRWEMWNQRLNEFLGYR
ncbi:hypothetical protein SNE40_008891 [Patella caerulea]|uniref:RING-type domain-containing protein n=2 Tax=Patella caerulea TaxID=87958 RepID=A0AAN8PPC5_PATCE